MFVKKYTKINKNDDAPPHTIIYHTKKLLPYGTAKESSIRKKCCSGGKRNCFDLAKKIWQNENQELIDRDFGYSGLKSIRGY